MPNNSKVQIGGEFIDLIPAAGGDYALAAHISGGTVVSTFQRDAYHTAFNELRVSVDGIRSDVEFIHDLQPYVFDDISANGGSVVWNSASRDVCIYSGTATASVGGMRSHNWIPYSPGSGGKVEITGTLDDAAKGGGTAFFFLRSAVTGSTVTTYHPIATAPTDTDWSKSHIFAMDFQSLKVGSIRYAMVVDGSPVDIAEIDNDNQTATGYWQYASLPPYWKQHNDGTVTVAEIGYGDEANGIGFAYFHTANHADARVRAICETVRSENGRDLLDVPGIPFSEGDAATFATVSTTLVPILSFRVKTAYPAGVTFRGLIVPESVSFQTDQPAFYRIIINGTVLGGSWSNISFDGENSAMEYNTGGTAITGGHCVQSGYIGTGGTRAGGDVKSITGKVAMSVNALGALGDVITIAAIRTGTTNAAVGAALNWKENK